MTFISYQWWTDTARISPQLGAGNPNGIDVFYLGALKTPTEATRVLITLNLINGKTTKPFFVSLTQPAETIRASY